MMKTNFQNCNNRQRRAGATILEVLFATVVIVVGLLGIATLIPFAARDAQTANNHNQAVSLGLAWADSFFARGLHITNANSSEDNFKWVWFRDYAANGSNPGWELLSRSGYTGAAAVRVAGTTFSRSGSSRPAGNQAFRFWGHQSICIDPFVLTSQSGLQRINGHIVGSSSSRPLWYRESTFPYFDEAYDPATDPFGTTAGFTTDQPRMIRAGLAFSIPAGVYTPITYAPVSNQLITNLFSSTDDLVEDAFIDEADRTEVSDSLPPKRLFQEFDIGGGVQIPTRPLLNKRFTWKATIVPEEPIPSDVDTPPKADLYAATPAKDALVSFLVLHRHSSEFVPTGSPLLAGDTENKPTGERTVRVYPLSGNFVGGAGGRVRLVGNQNVKSDLEVGDWIMLGRNYLQDVSTTRLYPYFRWYRIIGVDEKQREGSIASIAPVYPVIPPPDPPIIDQFGTLNGSEIGWARDVVLDGPDFAFGEYLPTEISNLPFWWPNPLTRPTPTTGTIVSGVVTVVERKVQLD